MSAKKCERCGAIYDPEISHDHSVIKYCYFYIERKIDLCSNCMCGLMNWLDSGGKEE